MNDTPIVLIIFGATGDLARNKLIPALFGLCRFQQLGYKFYIVGFSRRPFTNLQFREEVRNMLVLKGVKKKELELFLDRLHYQQGLFEDSTGYNQLIKIIHEFDVVAGERVKRIFYLATAPDKYNTILDFLEKTKLSKGHDEKNRPRVVVEKPFGKDLETAKMLDRKLSDIFAEEEIFRVDHYLGKETVQNILAFRFANSVFEPVWNNKYIDHVQITFAEKKGIMGRGKFFDGVGILRDVGQNHLMQLLAAVSMEQPKSFSKEDVRSVRTAAIQAINCIEPKNVASFVIRGQYAQYQEEKGVIKGSQTETFVAMKIFINSARFSGVPFYLRIGKKMPKNYVAISVVFRQTHHTIFKEFSGSEIGNVLTFHIQPNEGITVSVIAKRPIPKLALQPVNMHFSYKEAFGRGGVEAYEKILLDIFRGEQMLFNRSDELESSWEFITKILMGWSKEEKKILGYNDNTWGPKEADELIKKDGREWI